MRAQCNCALLFISLLATFSAILMLAKIVMHCENYKFSDSVISVLCSQRIKITLKIAGDIKAARRCFILCFIISISNNCNFAPRYLKQMKIFGDLFIRRLCSTPV